jgi:hypothetical protein
MQQRLLLFTSHAKMVPDLLQLLLLLLHAHVGAGRGSYRRVLPTAAPPASAAMPAPALAAKNAGASSGSQRAWMRATSRAYCRVVRTSSLNTTHSGAFPRSTEEGCRCTIWPVAITLRTAEGAKIK